MNDPVAPFDALLVLALLVLAWGALRAADLFKGIVLFMVFGLLMAVAWMRLGAPDIALAEAAIGSGVTGALLLAALARLERSLPAVGEVRPARSRPLLPGLAVVAALLCWSVLDLPVQAPGLAAAVESRLSESGTTNPVTAVILNYRGYDTLLEMGVLLIALIATAVLARPLGPGQSHPGSAGGEGDPVLRVFRRAVAPVFVAVGGYVVWVGGHAPGGAFQAGSLLAGLGVVAVLAGWVPPQLERRLALRAALAAGVLAFVLVGLWAMKTGSFLEYPPAQVKHLLLLIEVASTVAIGLILTLLFAYGARGPGAAAGDRP